MLANPPGSGGPARDDPAGQRADREDATRQLSQLLTGLQAESGRTWDQLADAAHVSRNTVRNYLGATLRRRDRTTVERLLDAMCAPAEQRGRVLELLPRTWDNATPSQRSARCVVVGRLPELAGSFQSRVEAEALWVAARPGTATVLTQGVGQTVVSGLGGVGKTQLAAHWARQLRDSGEVEVLVWVRAATATDILTGYADAAQSLGLAGTLGRVHGDLAGDARRFLNWLATTAQPWAIVLDNLEEPTAIRELWPPVTTHGRTVLTTRRRDASLLSGRAVVDVEVFTPEAAIAFLTARLPPHLAGVDVEGVAEDLGRLPLALTHAAAYMIERDLPCGRYRERFADRRRRLSRLFPDEDTLFDEAAATVASTWALSIDAADALPPRGVAGRVLQLASLLDPAGIPLQVLTAPAALTFCKAPSPDTITDAMTNLYRFNLITRTSDPAESGGDTPISTVGIHALVQRAVSDSLESAVAARAARAAADALLSCWPPERDAAVVGPLRANALALREARNDALWADTADRGGHPVLFRVVSSLGDAGLLAAAADAAAQLVKSAVAFLGPDHPRTLTARRGLARFRGEAGDPAGAVSSLDQLLDDVLRVRGPDHMHTLSTRYDLACWRGEAGDPAGAVTALEQVLDDYQRVLGPDHLRSLTTRHVLASWRGRAGDSAGAVTALEQVLDDYQRVLGPDHPKALSAGYQIADWRGEAGDPVGAVTALEQVLDDYQRVLGADHPDTLHCRRFLARWRGEAGDPAGAMTALEQVLDDYQRVLGHDHPRALTTRYYLADWLSRAGDSAGATAALEQLSDDMLRVLGPAHPDTLTTAEKLAVLRSEAGDPASALLAFKQLLNDRRRVLGPAHPHTLATRSDHARSRGAAGDPAGAATEFEELLDDYRRALSPDHPDTLTIRSYLADWRRRAGDLDGAMAAFEELVDDSRRVRGPDHPHTLAARNNLADCRGAAGDPTGATAAFEQLLDDYRRVLGPDHPDTLTTRHNLAYWCGQAGDPAGAAAAFEQLLADRLRVQGLDHPDTHATCSNVARWRSQAEDSAE